LRNLEDEPNLVTWILLFRYWALAVPTYGMVTILLALLFYVGLNFMSTPPPTSLNTIFGKLLLQMRESLFGSQWATCLYNNVLCVLQMSSVGNLQHSFHRWREMSSPLNPYLILASIKSMISCLMMWSKIIDLMFIDEEWTVHVKRSCSAKFTV
jgi:hypothetical protein